MSYSIRDQAQRKLKQAINNADTVLSYLYWFESTYREDHPELADIALYIANSQIETQELMEEFRDSF